MGWPLIFTPVHIAFLELIIDPVCSIVFEAEAAESRVMQRPPRRPGTPLLSNGLLAWSVAQGLLVWAVVGLFYMHLLQSGMADDVARTGSFVALVACNVGLILANRSIHSNMVRTLLQPNLAFWLMLLATVSMLSVMLFWQPAQSLFRFVAVPSSTMWQAVGMGCTVWLVLEASKWLLARRSAH
jgi:Ca2+-transporting ATPase